MGFVLPDADIRALSLAWLRLTCRVQLRRLCRRCAFGLAAPLGFGVGAWPLSCAGAIDLPGAAAAAMPPVRVWVGCALGFGLDAWPRGCAADTPDIAALFPLTNNRPLSEGAAGASRLGEL